MSSTNRGYDRHATDYYVTPKEAVKSFLVNWMSDLNGEFSSDYSKVGDRPGDVRWLDPCAGGDQKHDMTYPVVLKELFDVDAETIDIREDSLAKNKEDYLLADVAKFDVIITNPPFYLAEQIINKALKDVEDGGYVVMLLRLNFFGSKQRFPFWQNQLPVWAYVHHRRFSFTDDGKTDSIEYMHTVWQKNSDPAFTMLKVI